MFTEPQILRSKSLPKQICLAADMWLVSFFPFLPGIIKIHGVSTFLVRPELNASLGTVSMSDVAVATHISKYLTMWWKCKRFPTGFCALCAVLTSVPDLLWGHGKKGSRMDGLHGLDLPAGLINPIYIIAMQVTIVVALGGGCVTPALMEVRWVPNVLNSTEKSLCLLGEFSGSWDGSQSLRIFYVVVDVCAKAAMLDAPKGSRDSSRNEKSNPIKFFFPRGHFGERGAEFVRTWKEMSKRLWGLDRMLGL